MGRVLKSILIALAFAQPLVFAAVPKAQTTENRGALQDTPRDQPDTLANSANKSGVVEKTWTGEGLPEGFRKVSELGGGSFAKAFLVMENSTGKFWVMKVVKAVNENTANNVAREAAFIRQAAGTRPEDVVVHKDLKTGTHAIASPPIFEGPGSNRLALSLAKILEAHAADAADKLPKQYHLNPENAPLWEKAVQTAVDRLHARGIIHNDPHPDNILMHWDEHGNPVAEVIDFGLSSRSTDAEHPTGAVLFQSSAKLAKEPFDPADSDRYGVNVLKALIRAEAKGESKSVLLSTPGGLLPFQPTAAAVVIAEHGARVTPPPMPPRQVQQMCDAYFGNLSEPVIQRAIANIGH